MIRIAHAWLMRLPYSPRLRAAPRGFANRGAYGIER